MEKSAKKKERASAFQYVIERLNATLTNYAALPEGTILKAFSRASGGLANQPQLQNARIKAISSLPNDYTKEQIGDFLRTPYMHERELRQTSEILRWTAYPYYKIIKTYQDIPTYRYYAAPLYLEKNDAKTERFKREAALIDKFNKVFRPDALAHKITGQAMTDGKVFYATRYSVDKSHNKINYAFAQRLPQDWCTVIGENNISGWTVSFNLFYFMQPGTDYTQFGDLFEPFMDDFRKIIEKKEIKSPVKAIYASEQPAEKPYYVDYKKFNAAGAGNPRLFEQDGTWYYYVSLPVDRVWTFEIDDTTPAVASPLSGLMMTYAQQANFEEAQLALLLQPLVKIFTGEIPYFEDDGSRTEDTYKLSLGGRELFESLFNMMMSMSNTGGAAFFTAPVENIKSHDYAESANANDISSSFNRYASEKSGLAAIIPATDDPKAGLADMSAKLESRYSAATIYADMKRMMNYIYSSLGLEYEFDFNMFGSVYTEERTRDAALKLLATGDLSQRYVLAALDGQSMLDKLSTSYAVYDSGYLDYLIPPITSYTMKQETNGGIPPQAGRPEGEEMTEAKEKSTDET